MVPENIHTNPMKVHWKGGPKFIRESMKLNWKFQGGWKGSNEKTLEWGGGMDISGAKHYTLISERW